MKEEKNWLEWIVFGFSLLLIIGLIGFLSYLSITNNEASDPKLEVFFKLDGKQEDKHVLHVTVKNRGGTTAEDVKIEVVTWKQGKEEEKSEISFPFSPKNSTREGWVSFSKNPATMDSVTARVLGYIKP